MIKRLRCPNCGHIFNAAIGNEIAYVCCPHCRHDIDVVKNEIKE